MPNKKTAYKAVRQTKRHTQRNVNRRRAVKELTKTSIKAITAKTDDAMKAVLAACKIIDKAVQKGTLHPNTGARKKSRLMKRLNALTK